MGLCFSKKRQEKPPPPLAAEASTTKPKIAAVVAEEKAKKTVHKSAAAEPGKKAPLTGKSKTAAAGDAEEKSEEARPVLVTTVPVRTSSCTKEEVDAILIQCGRLSRSSSGRAASGETGGGHRRRGSKRSYDFDQERKAGGGGVSGETGGGHRRRGSKRSYDFDQERKAGGGGVDEEGDWEKNGVPVSRPSPHRGSPQRKRSGSRERTSGGSRRASRSPGRRAEGASSTATASSNGSRQQPGKMISVPAREKGRAPSPAAAAGKRCASPRSGSPARVAAVAVAGNENAGGGQKTAGPTPSLSRSSSRKAEQSPYRRSPMAELDENSLRNNTTTSKDTKQHKKSMEVAVAAAHQKPTDRSRIEKAGIVKDAIVAVSETRAPSSKTTATRTGSVVADNLNPRSGCRSRRSSRDFDKNPNLYASQLLEDIQSYHTSATAISGTQPSFSLPACVSKACSIVEAVADLNSSSSGNRFGEPKHSANDKGSINASFGADDLLETSVHKYVSVRDIRADTEPQESAGSNSISGNMWTPSCDHNTVDSADRTWSTSRTNNGDEVVEQGSSRHGAGSPLNRPRQSKQKPAHPEPSGRSRASATTGANAHRGHSSGHRGSGSVASGRSGIRAVSASSS